MKTFIDYHNLREETEPVLVKKEPDSVTLKINNTEYKLELAETPEQLYRGMGGRDYIPRKTGMLFKMPLEEMQGFCMRDCECNMDIIYVNSENKVVGSHTMHMERPRHRMESQIQYENRLIKYPSTEPASYAIELPAGDVVRLGIKNNQTINIPK